MKYVKARLEALQIGNIDMHMYPATPLSVNIALPFRYNSLNNFSVLLICLPFRYTLLNSTFQQTEL